MISRTKMALIGAICLSPPPLWAASCCGGGSATSLVLPKFSTSMINIALDVESYNGFWDSNGDYKEDPPGSDLNQYRLNFGYAHRLSSRWQAAIVAPYVWNSNQYAGVSSNTNGLGDMTLGLTYEAFDGIKCVWKVRDWKDLVPAAYFGMALTVPTGISPYDNVVNSFDITGRGFYRLDANMLLDKTIYPWNASLLLSYGKYLERDVNREYGNYVEPYKKGLGDRMLGTASFGYTHFLDNMDTMTFTFTYSHLEEDAGSIDGRTDYSSEMEKNSVGAIAAYSTMNRDWVYKLTFIHSMPDSGQGQNFPVTDILTVGVSHVFR
ncbi:MAG: transporter [Proteobacteria bacterium]|nr:transporter [Pseudomonadota bacterium]